MNRKLGGLVEVGDGESIKEQPSDAALHSLEVGVYLKPRLVFREVNGKPFGLWIRNRFPRNR